MSTATIYDHPLYYDILFGFDRSREVAFYEHCLVRTGGARILEVACGPARVGRLLARRGHRVTGLDRSPGMLAYARAAAAEEGGSIETLCADMSAFSCEVSFDAAVNPLSSFRLLHADTAVDAHLRCMGEALRPGGVYVLDLTLQGHEGEPVSTTDEAWEMSRGDVTVRADDDGIVVQDGAERHRLAWGTEGHLRGYTAADLAACVGRCAAFAIESWHPESSRATGVSEFAFEGHAEPPPGGRTMVVLRRLVQALPRR